MTYGTATPHCQICGKELSLLRGNVCDDCIKKFHRKNAWRSERCYHCGYWSSFNRHVPVHRAGALIEIKTFAGCKNGDRNLNDEACPDFQER